MTFFTHCRHIGVKGGPGDVPASTVMPEVKSGPRSRVVALDSPQNGDAAFTMVML